jgi:hypothetical protein
MLSLKKYCPGLYMVYFPKAMYILCLFLLILVDTLIVIYECLVLSFFLKIITCSCSVWFSLSMLVYKYPYPK